jgi:UDP-glucose 4-epimerase
MSFLITGGTGFIGSHIARQLVRENQDVVLFDASPDRKMIKGIEDSVTICTGDVTSTIDLIRAISKYDVKSIIHLAYYFTQPSQRDPLLATRINCEGTVNVFECSKILGVEKVVWASSLSVFGSSQEYHQFPLDEDAKLFPKTIYGTSKMYNEQVSLLYRNHFGLDCVAIRITGPYGWGMWKRSDSVASFVFDLFRKGGAGESCRVRGADVDLDWQYIKDVSQAFVLACKKKTKSGIFNTSGFRHKVRDAVELFRNAVPNPNIEIDSENPPQGAYTDYLDLDTALIKAELGFSPQYDLKSGIEDYLSDLRTIGTYET